MDKRTIKLRAWNTQENIMLYRSLFDINWYTTPTNDENGSHCWGPISGGQSRFLEVMQFTGFKHYDTEIYEGDIVEDEEGDRFCVIWDNDRFAFRSDLIGEKGYGMYDDFELKDVCTLNAVGLLGNIYENPNLLK